MKVPATILRTATTAASEHGVDRDLLLAIGAHESIGYAATVGDIDAGVSLGYWQVNLRGAGAEYRPRPWMLLDVQTNANVAARYLRGCLDAFPDDEARAISAYNQGVGGAQRADWWAVNGERYVRPVQRHLADLRQNGVEETADAELPAFWHQWGKTWTDVAENLKGVSDLALTRLRAAVVRAKETVAEADGL